MGPGIAPQALWGGASAEAAILFGHIPGRTWLPGARSPARASLGGSHPGLGPPPGPPVTGRPLPGHPNPCRVSIYPEEPTVEFGSSLLLNCTSSCRNYSRLNWEVSITKMGTQGPGWVSLSIPNVTSWSLELQCFGIFGQQRNIAETTLHAYRKDRGMMGGDRGPGTLPVASTPSLSFPTGFSPPQIYLEGDTVAGKEARVTCNTSAQVSPHDPPNLHLTLWGGGLPPSTHRGPSVGLSFTAQLEQHGQEVMCEAVLRLGRRTVNASAAVTLWVWGEFGDRDMGWGGIKTPHGWECRCRGVNPGCPVVRVVSGIRVGRRRGTQPGSGCRFPATPPSSCPPRCPGVGTADRLHHR